MGQIDRAVNLRIIHYFFPLIKCIFSCNSHSDIRVTCHNVYQQIIMFIGLLLCWYNGDVIFIVHTTPHIYRKQFLAQLHQSRFVLQNLCTSSNLWRMASTSCTALKVLAASVAVANRSGTIIRKILSSGNLGIVEKVSIAELF